MTVDNDGTITGKVEHPYFNEPTKKEQSFTRQTEELASTPEVEMKQKNENDANASYFLTNTPLTFIYETPDGKEYAFQTPYNMDINADDVRFGGDWNKGAKGDWYAKSFVGERYDEYLFEGNIDSSTSGLVSTELGTFGRNIELKHDSEAGDTWSFESNQFEHSIEHHYEVLENESVTTPFRQFEEVAVISETNTLKPETTYKRYYVKGIGMIKTEAIDEKGVVTLYALKDVIHANDTISIDKAKGILTKQESINTILTEEGYTLNMIEHDTYYSAYFLDESSSNPTQATDFYYIIDKSNTVILKVNLYSDHIERLQ